MSRLFTNSTSNFLRAASAPATAVPITLACWCMQTGAQATDIILFLGISSATLVHFFTLGTITAGVDARYRISDATATAATMTGIVANIWTQLSGGSAAANDHRGRRTSATDSTTGTSASSKTPVGVDRLSVGMADDLTPSLPFNGKIGQVAIWSSALTDQDFISLGAGVSPLRMRRDDLVFYAPINGVHSPETDIVGGRNFTINGTLAADDEPPIPHALKCI